MAKYVGLSALGVQATLIASLLVVDEVRKRRTSPRSFPAMDPIDTRIADNTITTYTEARSLYSDMLNAINTAEKYVFFETFLWKSDRVGQRFKDALIAAADRGVQVYVIYDGFGNLVVDPRFKIFPKHPNLHVVRVPEIRTGLLVLNLRKTGRDHRKLLVVDGHIGFVGGYNIGKLYADAWRDTHVRITGPAVWELDNGFVDFWNLFKKRNQPTLQDRGARRWNPRIFAALNLPSHMLYPVRGLYIDALDRASEKALLTSAYFIPDGEILRALINAARRGVKVRILLPEHSNHVVADWVSSAFFDELLAEGVEIYQYKHTMIHAKTATVDGHWSTVGTANIDRLSMFGNFEINMQFHSTDYAKVLQDIFDNDLTNSKRLTAARWAQRPVLRRVAEKILKPLAPLM
ncbi:phospholipase D-like domain-containing protein [Gleimia hominis]|uniref:phospholipase D-like domain-containing protein n=1 Tax=Gleimia hominis TaxID=595468 RepID=UPI001E2A803C|nr:phospholipase D-like domain-containing protein [Gleimia hominis]WIK63667.1 phospholipase D-like domain-containing protein [Gleimia hominis]